MQRLQLEKLLEVFRRGAAVAFVAYLIVFAIIGGYLVFLKGYDLRTFLNEATAQAAITAMTIWIIVFFGTYAVKEFFKYISGKEDVYIEGTNAILRIIVGIIMVGLVVFLIMFIQTVDLSNIIDIMLSLPMMLGLLVMLRESYNVYKAIK
ncbi:MAG: hypothetical protein QXW35_03845 [Candidatus Aenigmatarchaeota archaeon]